MHTYIHIEGYTCVQRRPLAPMLPPRVTSTRRTSARLQGGKLAWGYIKHRFWKQEVFARPDKLFDHDSKTLASRSLRKRKFSHERKARFRDSETPVCKAPLRGLPDVCFVALSLLCSLFLAFVVIVTCGSPCLQSPC